MSSSYTDLLKDAQASTCITSCTTTNQAKTNCAYSSDEACLCKNSSYIRNYSSCIDSKCWTQREIDGSGYTVPEIVRMACSLYGITLDDDLFSGLKGTSNGTSGASTAATTETSGTRSGSETIGLTGGDNSTDISSGSDSGGKSKTPIIIGASVGAVVLIIAAAVAGFFLLRRRSRRHGSDGFGQEVTTPANPDPAAAVTEKPTGAVTTDDIYVPATSPAPMYNQTQYPPPPPPTMSPPPSNWNMSPQPQVQQTQYPVQHYLPQGYAQGFGNAPTPPPVGMYVTPPPPPPVQQPNVAELGGQTMQPQYSGQQNQYLGAEQQPMESQYSGSTIGGQVGGQTQYPPTQQTEPIAELSNERK